MVQALVVGDALSGHAVTVEGVGGIVVVHAGVPQVGTGLGNGVDGTALETALAHVEGRDVHTDLLNGVQGDGAAAGGKVLADAEGVVERGAVNGDGRAAVVAAAHRETAGGGGTLRGEGHHIVHAAGNRGDALDFLAADVGGDTVALAAEAGGVGHHQGFAEFLGLGVHPGVQDGLFAQFQVDLVEHHALVTQVGDFDAVRAAGAHTVDQVAAFGVGHGAVNGAGRSVGGNDCRANDGFSLFVGNPTAEGGGGHLSKGDTARNHHSECKQKAFEDVLHKNLLG